jgi:hypothetical protein
MVIGARQRKREASEDYMMCSLRASQPYMQRSKADQ